MTGRGCVWVLFSRNRRKIFSTSMIESSTTSPSAMTSPPSVIVLIVIPSFSSTMTAVSSETGIAVSEIAAVRALPSKRNSTTATNTPPSASECFMFRNAASMNDAGRCSRGKTVMPCFSNTGFSSASAASSDFVTSIVFAPYWLDIVINTPGFPMMTVSPNFGSAPSITRATSLSRTLKPFVCVTTTSPICSGVSDCPSV